MEIRVYFHTERSIASQTAMHPEGRSLEKSKLRVAIEYAELNQSREAIRRLLIDHLRSNPHQDITLENIDEAPIIFKEVPDGIRKNNIDILVFSDNDALDTDLPLMKFEELPLKSFFPEHRTDSYTLLGGVRDELG